MSVGTCRCGSPSTLLEAGPSIQVYRCNAQGTNYIARRRPGGRFKKVSWAVDHDREPLTGHQQVTLAQLRGEA